MRHVQHFCSVFDDAFCFRFREFKEFNSTERSKGTLAAQQSFGSQRYGATGSGCIVGGVRGGTGWSQQADRHTRTWLGRRSFEVKAANFSSTCKFSSSQLLKKNVTTTLPNPTCWHVEAPLISPTTLPPIPTTEKPALTSTLSVCKVHNYNVIKDEAR